MSQQSVNEFNQQLKDTEDQMVEISREYPDLSPEDKTRCLERVEQAVSVLKRIKRDFQKDMSRHTNVLQIIGLDSESIVLATARNFENSFKEAVLIERVTAGRYVVHERYERETPERLVIVRETNYTPDHTGKLKKTDDIFVQFHNDADMDYAFGRKELNLKVPSGERPLQTASGCVINQCRVKFATPLYNASKRKTFREIGALVESLNAIEEEYKTMGAERLNGSKPELAPGRFIDRAWLLHNEMMPKWKRMRSSGLALDTTAFAALRRGKIVDMRACQARIDALYNDECDILIKLREFQLDGFEFDY